MYIKCKSKFCVSKTFCNLQVCLQKLAARELYNTYEQYTPHTHTYRKRTHSSAYLCGIENNNLHT